MTKRQLKNKIGSLIEEAKQLRDPAGIPELLYMVAYYQDHGTRQLAEWCKFFSEPRLNAIKRAADDARKKAIDQALGVEIQS